MNLQTNRAKLKSISAVLAMAVMGTAVWSHYSTTVRAESPTATPATPAMQSPVDLSKVAGEMADSAQNFWASLTPEQQAKAGFAVKDDERLNWHFIPKPRKGLPIKEMTSAQRALAHALLSSGLSYQGFSRAVTIMSLDQVLHDIENGKGPVRDPEGYFFSIFGTPGDKGSWGWRVEGHHLSLNFTIVGGKEISATPAFFGNNPAKVLEGPRAGLRSLPAEEDMGRQFVKSLSEDQKKKGILAEPAPKDIYTAAARKAQLDSNDGVAWADLNPAQREALKGLVKLYADRHRGEIASQDLQKIDAAGWDKVIFAWQGGVETGQPHYYRIKGTTFLVEYDNTQNNANHIHTVWRDLQNDFGEDVLAKHLMLDHAGK